MIVRQEGVEFPMVAPEVVFVHEKTETQHDFLQGFTLRILFELLGQVLFTLFAFLDSLDDFRSQITVEFEDCPEVSVNLWLENQTQE
jgi:hypothetical protein